MIKKSLLCFGLICIGFGVNASCLAEGNSQDEQDGLMDKLRLASTNSLQGKSVILKIKERTNAALLGQEDSTDNDLDFDTVLSLRDLVVLDIAHEAPDSAVTQKKLKNDLCGQIRFLVSDFFKTDYYAKMKKNIDAFYKFVSSCPAWQSIKRDEKLFASSLDGCFPENFTGDMIKYIYEGDHVVGFYWYVKATKELSSKITLEVEYAYCSRFERVEERSSMANSQLRQDVVSSKLEFNVTPAPEFFGSVRFVCKDGARINETGYRFYLLGSEVITLKNDPPFNESPAGGGTDLVGIGLHIDSANLDTRTALTASSIKNEVFYKSYEDHVISAKIADEMLADIYRLLQQKLVDETRV